MPERSTLQLDSSLASIRQAAAILQRGGLVAIPTETVYGLAANALNPRAVAAIFAAKGRPDWDPLIVHVASLQLLAHVAEPLSPAAAALAEAFWPGPLTMLLPRTAAISDAVTAGRPLVGVRWPAHPVAQAILSAAALPLAAPSANRFGHISPSTAAHVLADLGGCINAVLDGGPTGIGIESTVLDPNTTPMTIYRQGAVTAADVERVTGISAQIFQPNPQERPQTLPSPGVGIRHYAPRTPLQLVTSQAHLWEALHAPGAANVGVLLPHHWHAPQAAHREPWGDWDNTAELAHNLYAALRTLDGQGSSLLLAPLPDEQPGDDLRSALRDRLRKAAMPAAPGEDPGT